MNALKRVNIHAQHFNPPLGSPRHQTSRGIVNICEIMIQTCTDPGQSLDHHPFVVITTAVSLQDVQENLLEENLSKNSTLVNCVHTH